MNDSKIKLADEIAHLSAEEIEELYKRYISGEKNSELVEEYKINIHPNNLIKLLPPKIIPDKKCPYCNIPMYQKRKSKSNSYWNDPPIECYSCNHKREYYRFVKKNKTVIKFDIFFNSDMLKNI